MRLNLTRLLALTLAILLASACGPSGPKLMERSKEKRPAWTNKPSNVKGNPVKYFVGRATGQDSRDKARTIARQNAMQNMAMQVAVTVGGKIETVEAQAGGNYQSGAVISTSTKAHPIQVQGIQWAEDYTETWHRNGKTEYDHYALVSVPSIQIHNAVCKIGKKVLLLWNCDDGGSGACSDKIIPKIREAATERSYTLIPDTLKTNDKVDLVATGMQSCAAYVIEASVSVKFMGQSGDEFYAEARGNARLVETDKGREFFSFNIDPVKGGHYSKNAAMKAAMNKVVDELSSRLQYQLPEFPPKVK